VASFYNIGDRKTNIIHTKPRHRCSGLNADLYMRKTKIKYPWTRLATSKIQIFAMVFSIFHFLKHYYNGIFHISLF
jgi:hypothetical protein